ncbi:uncharacterized protein EV422DRAFT_503678 [Fimicolochytrium jonesii]|uniref:uncharacterized protein n=1 Tax=Fimicolochytrium jonesii TaxID=1396493 RepID=UPI0022FE04F6|nr:uncharacterized protein EV422DRAFT_503678 [Fimicolochytrium jonesii]KAI8824893.1 hypothetical protein EV422DRAFT_503678 [Fimicolochytrium jonesii]
MSSHQAVQGHLWGGFFTGATTPRRKRRKVTPVTPRLPINPPTAVQTPLQPPRFEFPPSVKNLPQAIADMVSESSGDEDGQQHQQRGLSPVDRGLQRPLNLPAPIPFLFPSTPGGSLVYEPPPPPPPVQRPRPQTHASTKVSLHRIHNQNQVQRERLTTFIGNVHVLARHTTFFLKYYLVRLPTTADHPLHDFPDITDKHISVMFELLNNPGYNGNPVIAQELRPWVQDYCNVHGFAPIRMQYCQQTAGYTATSIFTNLKVNVQEHFIQMLLRYVNERLGLKQVVLHLRRAGVNRAQRRHYYQRVRQFTKYATFEEFPTEEEFARLTRLERTVLDKLWALFPPQDEPLAYSLAVDAMPYLGASQYFEHHIDDLREAPNIVCIDPGKRDLLFCQDNKKERPFRYTSNQRAVETKSRYFRRDMTERKINAGVAEMESQIPSHRSMNIEAFSAFIVDYEHAGMMFYFNFDFQI